MAFLFGGSFILGAGRSGCGWSFALHFPTLVSGLGWQGCLRRFLVFHIYELEGFYCMGRISWNSMTYIRERDVGREQYTGNEYQYTIVFPRRQLLCFRDAASCRRHQTRLTNR